ncbi:MAG TPA: hypothetical protein VHE08_07120 [Solirubrobacterales bacterium]|nr:hypothetical protein [Solirubrobacterales bacterium]
MRGESQARALSAVLRGSAIPYGYALTVLAAHSIISHRHGPPDVYDIALFIVGALAGFGALGMLARARPLDDLEVGHREMIGVGMANVLAIGVAFAGVTVVSLVHGRIAWALGAGVATYLYLSITTLEVTFVGRGRR